MSRTIKRILSLLLCAALLFGAAPLNGFVGLHWPQLNLPSFSSLFAVKARAEDNPTSGTCGDNLTWEYDEDTATLTISGTGTMNNYNLGRVDPVDHSLQLNDAPWQAYYQTMQTVVINSGVTSIGRGAFYVCSGLMSVSIADSVTSIDESAFGRCTGLTSVIIPNSVTTIGGSVFSGCTGLTSVTIGSSVASIGAYAFSGCSGLTSVTIPNSVTNIAANAFYNCTGLTDIVFPNSITTISSYVFSGCTGLTSVTIPNSVTNIAANAFYNCTGLTDIVFPNSVTTIGSYAFSGCSGLTSVTIPNSVASIGNCAFESQWLTSITVDENNTTFHSIDNCLIETSSKTLVLGCKNSIIPADGSVTSIGNSAFYHCTGLTDIDIPNGVMSIGSSAFYNCTGLTGIVIPNSVTTIGSYAFSGCSGLTSVTISNSITSIGNYAFYNCTGLTNIVIPNSVTTIGSYAFSGCTGLTNVTISNNVTSIGDGTFNDCSGLTSITIPKSVTSVSVDAFSGCTGLNSITVDENNTTYHSANNCLIDTSNKTLVLGCKNSTIPIDGSVLSIGDDAFRGCTGLTSVTIPDSVMSIGNGAFNGCVGLISITISDSVTNISLGDWYYLSSPFSGCSGLINIVVEDGNPIYHSSGNCLIETASKTLIKGCNSSVIPTDGTVTSICDNAFNDCTGLTSITIPNTVTSIGYQAFCYCSGLTSITIPESVTSIGPIAFGYCSGLTEINYNVASISNLGYSAFSSLGMTEEGIAVTFGDSVKNIPSNLFGYQERIRSVTISDSVKSIGENAFGNGISIANVVFTGNLGQWRRISIANNNGSLTNATITYLGGEFDSGSCGDNLTWTYDLNTCVLTINGTGAMSSYSNSSYNGTSVTTAPWRSYYQSMKTVVIEDGVTSISGNAFYGCSGLTSVTIGNSVTSIGTRAFYNCTGLTEIYYNAVSVTGLSSTSYVFSGAGTAETGVVVTFGDSVDTIPAYLFNNCSELTSVTIGNRVTSIGTRAFYNCTGLTEIYYNAASVTDLSSNLSVFSNVGTAGTGVVVTFGDSVETIPAYLFNNCSELTSVTIGNNVTSIGASAFNGCTGLTSISIPNSVSNIGASAFNGCTGLTSISIPNSVSNIGASAFNGCTGLTSISIPNSVSSIGASAFRGCTGLTTAGPIGGGYDYEFGWTNSIPSNAFYGCSSLTSVVISDSITGIGENAFNYCTDLTKVNITDLSVWCSISFSHSSNPLRYAHNLYLNDVLVTDLVIPDSVTSIGNYALCSCTGLTSVTIPDSVTSIGNYAFDGCTSLSTVYYNAVSVNNAASPFYGISSLKTVIVGECVECLPANLFRGAENIEQVILPRSVKTINKTFLDANCDAIVYCPKGSYAQTCCIRYGWVYGLLDSNFSPEFIIANGALLHYVGSKAQVLLPQVDTIGAGALNGNTQVVSVEISSATSEIFDEAFANCSVLQRVVIPSSVTFISGYAFADSDNVVIYCVEGSYAQQFAMSNGIPYELITVTFNRPEVVLRPNQTLQLNAVYSVALCETDLLWQSDNEDVVTVDNNGLVTAVGNGRATVTAANENGLTVQCVVGVTDSDFSLQQTKGELDASTNLLYGLHAGVTADELKNEYFTTNGTCRLDCEGMLATGDKVSLIETTTGVKAAEYTVVIFGDVDGNGWYDGTDAYSVSLVANGLIPASALTEAQRMAADANHDGNIDVADVALLEQAGLLLNDIDQTAPQEELETNSVYLEYCGLIDQSIEIHEPVQPTQAEETPAAQSVLGWIKALFAFVLNWLLHIF